MPVLKLKEDKPAFEIGAKVRVGDKHFFEIFDKKDNELLVGKPGHHPRQSKSIQCNPADHKPGHYIEHGGELCRIDVVEGRRLVISRRVRL